MKIEIIWSGGIFGINRDKMPDVAHMMRNGFFKHIGYKRGLGRLGHILRAQIPANDVGDLICIEPRKSESVGEAIVRAECKLWFNAIENPNSIGGNIDGISFAWAEYPILTISVKRKGNRWHELWEIRDYVDMSARFPRRGHPTPRKLPSIPLPLDVKQYRVKDSIYDEYYADV